MFKINLDKCIFSLLHSTVKKYDVLHDVVMSVHKVALKLETVKTDVPVCPWCGHRYETYEKFYLKDYVILCCKLDYAKTFRVVKRYSGGLVCYDTFKINHPPK